ncbi:DUF2905 domain-containing protein [Candidatus Woesebacteria bacterium]|nr:DUF2905 domain-containing protein [Candidatus Woesebacteria bacterium]
MQFIKTIILLYGISIALMYFLSSRRRQPLAFPGDIVIYKAGKTIYIPWASSLLITLVLFIILRSISS